MTADQFRPYIVNRSHDHWVPIKEKTAKKDLSSSWIGVFPTLGILVPSKVGKQVEIGAVKLLE